VTETLSNDWPPVDDATVRESLLDNLRHDPTGVSKTPLVTRVERDTDATVESILTVFDELERRGELYRYESDDETVVKATGATA